MRIAIFSDIHANWAALERAIADAESQRVQRYWSLGDVVDRGAYTRRCLEWVWAHCEVHLLGNHEETLLCHAGRDFPPHPIFTTPDHVGINLSGFSRDTLEQSRRQLTDAQLDRIAGGTSTVAVLPDGAIVCLTATHPEPRPDIVLVHGSPVNTTHWRIRSDADALSAFVELRGRAEVFQPPGLPRVIFAGHTHWARAWQVDPVMWQATEHPLRVGKALDIANGYWTITVGSVGEPHDYHDLGGDYGILDTDAYTFTRRSLA